MVDASDAVLLWVAHLTKAAERKALYRPGASIAFVAAARVALIVGEHPDEPNQADRPTQEQPRPEGAEHVV